MTMPIKPSGCLPEGNQAGGYIGPSTNEKGDTVQGRHGCRGGVALVAESTGQQDTVSRKRILMAVEAVRRLRANRRPRGRHLPVAADPSIHSQPDRDYLVDEKDCPLLDSSTVEFAKSLQAVCYLLRPRCALHFQHGTQISSRRISWLHPVLCHWPGREGCFFSPLRVSSARPVRSRVAL